MAIEPEKTTPETTPESEPAPTSKKPRTKSASKKATAEKKAAAPRKVKAAAAKTGKTKTHKTKAKSKGATSEADAISTAAEASAEAEMAAYRDETADVAVEGTLEVHDRAHAATEPAAQEEHEPEAEFDEVPSETDEDAEAAEDEPSERVVKSGEFAIKTGEPAKLDRLQKILSQAGIASRRRAEELITEGRVQVNGQVVSQLGAKADPARDHIRVDGKLISAAERHRYFVLNKPRGYVTTASDPEGRPTVMEFFTKMKERLYPVGRLDYQSEGLLLVTNDGELANQLTRAASGVEKTYLVKVAGRPSEEELEQLRSGVGIDREGPGSGKVHTAPAVIRQIRQGENPWFEVVLIEGRNRELRKMFSAVGHFVEKIRRVGYGPLILDLEPGKFRELMPEELAALRLAAEGKLKPRRQKASRLLPKEAGKPAQPPAARRFTQSGTKAPERHGHPERPFRGKTDRPPRPERFQPDRPGGDRPRSDHPRPGHSRPDRFGASRFQSDRGPNKRTPTDRFQNDRFRNERSSPDRTRNDGLQIDRVQNDRAPNDRAANDRTSGNRGEGGNAGRSEFGRREGGDAKRFTPRREFRPDRERPSRGGADAEATPARNRESRGGSSFRPHQREQAAPGRSWDNRTARPPFKPQGESARRFDKPAGRSFGKPSFKSGSKGPAPRRDRSESGRPVRSEGSAQPFRDKSGPRPGKANPPLGNRSRPAFGSGTGGSRPGGSRPGGSRPPGSRPGGSRPDRSGPSGFKRSGPRPGSGPGSRSGSRKRG
jgi:23S rRNA pseudouridine2605 synthase